MLQLNLLPDVKKEYLHAQRQRNFVISVCIFASIIAGGAVLILGGILGAQAIQKGIISKSIDDSESEIKKMKTDKQLDEYLTVQNQLSKIESLKDDQLSYSRLLDYLVNLNPAAPNNVSLDSVEVIDASGSATDGGASSGGVKVELSGTIKDYSSLSVFETTLAMSTISYSKGDGEDVLTELLFNSTRTESSSLGNDGKVSFKVAVEFNKAAFARNSKDIKISVPNETTSDSDRNSPKDIFIESTTSSEESSNGQ